MFRLRLKTVACGVREKKTLRNFGGWCTQLFLALMLVFPPPHIWKSKWINQRPSPYAEVGLHLYCGFFCCCSNANMMSLVTEHSDLSLYREAWMMQKWHKNLLSSFLLGLRCSRWGRTCQAHGISVCWSEQFIEFWAAMCRVKHYGLRDSKIQNGKSQCAHVWVGSPVSFLCCASYCKYNYLGTEYRHHTGWHLANSCEVRQVSKSGWTGCALQSWSIRNGLPLRMGDRAIVTGNVF